MANDLRTRFVAQVDKSGECWTWTGARNAQGYGRTRAHGRDARAHRVAWELERGPIPDGLCVLHRCDNPPCVRVEHLFLGTKADNAKDCAGKGRNIAQVRPDLLAKGVRRWSSEHPERRARGEKNGSAKLTAETVMAMRERFAAGASERIVAREFGIGKSQAHNIRTGKHWPADLRVREFPDAD